MVPSAIKKDVAAPPLLTKEPPVIAPEAVRALVLGLYVSPESTSKESSPKVKYWYFPFVELVSSVNNMNLFWEPS